VRREVLNAVVIKGIAGTDAVADAVDLPADEVAKVLTGLADEGLVKERTGRLAGWAPTAEGREERTRLMREHRDDPDASQPDEAAHAAFTEVNTVFKQLCTDWQAVKAAHPPVPGAPVDAGIAERLAEVHVRVLPVVDRFTAAQPRFGAYARRLAAAKDRFTGGDANALTSPRQDSYHDVWMELHADILATLGLARTAADGT